MYTSFFQIISQTRRAFYPIKMQSKNLFEKLIFIMKFLIKKNKKTIILNLLLFSKSRLIQRM